MMLDTDPPTGPAAEYGVKETAAVVARPELETESPTAADEKVARAAAADDVGMSLI